MLKDKRQETIRDLIRANDIASQSELAMLLTDKGFQVTQSSVSRDLVEIGVIKVKGFYALPEIQTENQRYGLLSLDTAGENLIVGKCEAGLASAVTVKIDGAKMSEIVGTIAGDDTIFIAVKSQKTQKAAIKKIWEMFGR
jgi:transcriptional regulator of arginine metabolism